MNSQNIEYLSMESSMSYNSFPCSHYVWQSSLTKKLDIVLKKRNLFAPLFWQTGLTFLPRHITCSPDFCRQTESGAFHHARDTAEQGPLICETHCQSAALGTVDWLHGWAQTKKAKKLLAPKSLNAFFLFFILYKNVKPPIIIICLLKLQTVINA